MKTHSVKPADIHKKWILINATDQTVGRLASEIAHILRGKHKPDFTPHIDCGDFVVVTNAEKVTFTGSKWSKKEYHWHTQWMGGLKTANATDMLKRHPDSILRKAVEGMLPKNKLGSKMAKNLKIYAGEQHPHEAQNPVKKAPRLAGMEG